MSFELRKDESGQPDDSMKVVDGEKLSEPEVSIRQNADAPRADEYPPADEYQEYQSNYQQNMYQQPNYGQQQNNGQQPNYGTQYNYGNPNDGQQYYGQVQQQKSQDIGFGLASMILGIVSLLMFCTCINYILAILAIVFGIIQIVRCEKRGMAIAGIVTGGLSILLATIMWIGFSSMSMNEGNPFYQYLEEYYESGDDSF
jgi:hypothetical protein